MGFIESLTNEPLQLLIPIISGLIGWLTNVVAVEMMFHPVKFVGIKPYLGWQGIIPANAVRLAGSGLKLVMDQVLNVNQLFEGFTPEAFVATQEARLKERTRMIVEEQVAERFPKMWNALAPAMREQVIGMVLAEVITISEQVVGDTTKNIDSLMDIHAIVTGAVIEDNTLMGELFLSVGVQEFKFIKISGLYFGFAFGLVQFMVWMLYPVWWILPLFGLLVGYATNWLALKLIFEPRETIKVGPFGFQGLFHRRQKEISKAFSEMMTAKLLTSEALFENLTTGRSREVMMGFVRTRIREAGKRFEKHPMVMMMAANPAAQALDPVALEVEMLEQVEGELFAPDGMMAAFTDRADEIRENLAEKMSIMDPGDFENVLRPAFKQDEWKLILAGAILGLAAGFAQLVFLFGDLVLGSS